MKKNVRCAVIGQHPMRFPWGFDEEDDGCRRMKLEMAQRIMELRQRGVTEFQVPATPAWGCTLQRSSIFCGRRINSFGWSASYPMRSRLPNGRRSFGSATSICSRDARNWTASTSMSSLTPSFWPISGSSNSRAWCWPFMIPTLRMGAPRIRLCPMRLHWAGQSC